MFWCIHAKSPHTVSPQLPPAFSIQIYKGVLPTHVFTMFSLYCTSKQERVNGIQGCCGYAHRRYLVSRKLYVNDLATSKHRMFVHQCFRKCAYRWAFCLLDRHILYIVRHACELLRQNSHVLDLSLFKAMIIVFTITGTETVTDKTGTSQWQNVTRWALASAQFVCIRKTSFLYYTH